MYWPATATQLTAEHQFFSNVTTNLANAVGALFDAVNASAYGTFAPDVVIINDRDFPQRVTYVSCNTLPDNQLRREDKMRPTATHTTPLA
jgi:hypothetical protein